MKQFNPVFLKDTVWESSFEKFASLRDLEKDYKETMSHKDQDLINAEANKNIRQAMTTSIESIMLHAESFGFRAKTYVSGTSKRQGHYKPEKWVEELKKQLPSTSYYRIYDPDTIVGYYTDYERYYQKRKKTLEFREKDIKIQEERNEENKKKDKLAIRLAAKWDLPEEITERSDIVESLADKDKYIMLAWAMEETRNDWSDGFYRVSNTLRRFVVETETDKEIVDDILSCFNDTDGRVFRDTQWNYNVLYTLGNQELLADIQKIS